MIVYIVQTNKGLGYAKDEEAKLYNNERDVLQLVADVAAGAYNHIHEETEIKNIYKVDLTYGKTTQLKPVLEGYKMELKELA